MTILDDIARYKRAEVAAAKAAVSAAQVAERAAKAAPVRPFAAALRRRLGAGETALIAEIKKASPSKGLIRADFDPPSLARAYERGGAAALSVLTDAPSFHGAPAFLEDARAAVDLPVLRKDFLLDPYQVAESRAMGADCILIILAMVDDALAAALEAEAERWGMDVLIETHDGAEMARAAALRGAIVGVNNRNLHTFETSLSVTASLAPLAPSGRVLVAESGIQTRADVAGLRAHGVRTLLVGESLMRAPDVETATRELLRP
jgi:indole-3-glycerol phosphate synthase